ncbi:hypothetical protein LX36DRAFT_355481 [Colletotrichum falcatum]|nr:hypothetical protein LX36DRAFT_355481 [Colletotrichum falcatum]
MILMTGLRFSHRRHRHHDGFGLTGVLQRHPLGLLRGIGQWMREKFTTAPDIQRCQWRGICSGAYLAKRQIAEREKLGPSPRTKGCMQWVSRLENVESQKLHWSSDRESLDRPSRGTGNPHPAVTQCVVSKLLEQTLGILSPGLGRVARGTITRFSRMLC